jgi:hypothetical protein
MVEGRDQFPRRRDAFLLTLSCPDVWLYSFGQSKESNQTEGSDGEDAQGEDLMLLRGILGKETRGFGWGITYLTT